MPKEPKKTKDFSPFIEDIKTEIVKTYELLHTPGVKTSKVKPKTDNSWETKKKN